MKLSLVERVELAKRPIGKPEEHSGLILPPFEITFEPTVAWLVPFMAGAIFTLIVVAFALAF